jgi:hypothetical protein
MQATTISKKVKFFYCGKKHSSLHNIGHSYFQGQKQSVKILQEEITKDEESMCRDCLKGGLSLSFSVVVTFGFLFIYGLLI